MRGLNMHTARKRTFRQIAHSLSTAVDVTLSITFICLDPGTHTDRVCVLQTYTAYDPHTVNTIMQQSRNNKHCVFVALCACSLFGSIQEEVVKDAESVRNQQQQHLQQHSCTLDECFQLYTKEEQVRQRPTQLTGDEASILLLCILESLSKNNLCT